MTYNASNILLIFPKWNKKDPMHPLPIYQLPTLASFQLCIQADAINQIWELDTYVLVVEQVIKVYQ